MIHKRIPYFRPSFQGGDVAHPLCMVPTVGWAGPKAALVGMSDRAAAVDCPRCQAFMAGGGVKARKAWLAEFLSRRTRAGAGDPRGGAMSAVAAVVTVMDCGEPAHKLGMPRLLSSAAREIAAKHNLSIQELMGRRKPKPVALARQELMWVLHKRGLSSVRIGMFLDRDHATVLHGVRAHEARRHAERQGEAA